MTDEERTIKKLNQLIRTADGENYGFVYLNTGTAKLIVRLLQGSSKAERPKPDLIRAFRCPECRGIVPEGARYCGDCGQEIKWQ